MTPSRHDTTPQFLLRPAQMSDVTALERFAEASGHGLTTLPHDRNRLIRRVENSLASFATDDPSGEETYLFVLEDRHSGRTIGVSGITAHAGFSERFYCFRNEFVVHRSDALACSQRVHTLHPCHDLTGTTLLTSFYLEDGYAHTLAPQLLSRARLMFIAQHSERFADRIASESPGLADGLGRCPFWDAVGRRFFAMDYPSVERMAEGRSKSFIAELMPNWPIYVPLLSSEAQWAIGQLHPDANLPFSILVDEGFEADTYVDIFDAGPIVVSRASSLRTVRGTVIMHTAPSSSGSAAGTPHLVANLERNDFLATVIDADTPESNLRISQNAISALGLSPQALVCALTAVERP